MIGVKYGVAVGAIDPDPVSSSPRKLTALWIGALAVGLIMLATRKPSGKRRPAMGTAKRWR